MNPAQVEALFSQNPSAPLFRADGADEPGGTTFNRLRTHATIAVNIPLPANVSLVGSTSRTVTLNRGIPTTMNTPALDDVLMYDGRAPNVQEQARGALLSHAGTSNVTQAQLDTLASFERTLFNRDALREFAKSGTAPVLPEGKTPAEKRGRVFFVDDPIAVSNGTMFRCVHCHSGPNLDETSPAFEAILGVPKGSRFQNILVSEFNTLKNPVYEFEFTNTDGTKARVSSPDPGRALITGRAADAGSFKISTIWGAKDTAPYFHDNSAATLEDVVRQYQLFIKTVAPGSPFEFTDAHAADMVAYMKLL